MKLNNVIIIGFVSKCKHNLQSTLGCKEHY